MRIATRTITTALAATAVLLLAGCSTPAVSSDPASSTPADASPGAWPRVIEHAAGSIEITEQPVRIVSTSPSLTGSLLAIDAPVVATSTALVSNLSDDKGFFVQWADVADDRGVEVLYSNLELDLDAVDAFAPDLIIGSANGGDTTLEAYGQLSDIAPTVLLDYSTATWQELTTELAGIVGLEENATKVLDEFDSWVAGQAEQIELPEQPVTALVYLGADGAWAFARDAAQAVLLESLGFEYEDVPEEAATTAAGPGLAVVTAENLPAAFAVAQTLFVVPLGSEQEVDEFAADPLLVGAPAVTGDRVYSLGAASFRLDYYSATDTVEHLVSIFGR